ncbi:helix-turn-helix domain-containing protein [Nocardia salmonicida]|uniref:helix-turn-helix domain-containing protein n=1 Tax=Nocardia salmonicida TaxID=53431 RepID=UPI0038B373BE
MTLVTSTRPELRGGSFSGRMRNANPLSSSYKDPPCLTVMPRCQRKGGDASCDAASSAHVAAEMGISRQCASNWVNRFRRYGDLGLGDRSSTRHRSPTAISTQVVTPVEALRRNWKWSARRIQAELASEGAHVSVRTVGRHLVRLGLNRRCFLDPTGDTNRASRPIIARRPGHMIHVDINKVDRIRDGGGWRVHGRDSAQHKANYAAKARGERVATSFCTPQPTATPVWPSAKHSPTKRPSQLSDSCSGTGILRRARHHPHRTHRH